MNNTFKTRDVYLPKKLVIVGMRYHSTEAQSYISSAGANFKVTISREFNDKGSGNTAWRVHSVSRGLKLGYVREADKGLLDNLYVDTGITSFEYAVTTKMVNWLLAIPIMGSIMVPTPVHVNVNPIPKEIVIGKSETCALGLEQEYKVDFNNNTNKENSKMNINSMRDSFFREIKFVVIDMTTGTFGITTSEGITSYKDGTMSVNPITDMGISIPAFAMRTDIDSLKEGDIVLNGSEVAFFKGKTEGGYSVVNTKGEVKQIGGVKNLFLGKNSVLAVKNMFAGTEGAKDGGMNPMMLAMMMMGDKEDSAKGFDMKTFALMSMMSGSKGMDSNMMMMMALMGK